MTKQVLRASDIAAELGLTTNRVYQLIASGSIPAVRVGRSIRVSGEAWEQWRRQNQKDAAAPAASGGAGQ